MDFFLSELILYKPFHNVERHIGHDDDTIVENWDSFNYNPWHVQRQEHAQNDEPSSDSEMEDNRAIQENTTEHEWEITYGLHRGQHMPVSEIDMLGRRDIDRNTNWCSEYQTEEETIRAINFIPEMKKHGCLMYDDIP